MDWSTVGQWIKSNAGPGAALVGSLITGNIPGAVAAGVAMVSSATGTNDPMAALQTLQQDPATVIRLKEIAAADDANVRAHLQSMATLELENKKATLQDAQAEHAQTQDTIRAGDASTDEYVRRTRPKMARESWYIAAAYIVIFDALKQYGLFNVGATVELAMILISPAAAYIGFRSMDKRKNK